MKLETQYSNFDCPACDKEIDGVRIVGEGVIRDRNRLEVIAIRKPTAMMTQQYFHIECVNKINRWPLIGTCQKEVSTYV